MVFGAPFFIPIRIPEYEHPSGVDKVKNNSKPTDCFSKNWRSKSGG